MHRTLMGAVLGLTLIAAAAHAENTDKNTGGTAKGAAVGALAGHEVGSGHAVAGAVVGGAIGHHEKKKAEQAKNKAD